MTIEKRDVPPQMEKGIDDVQQRLYAAGLARPCSCGKPECKATDATELTPIVVALLLETYAVVLHERMVRPDATTADMIRGAAIFEVTNFFQGVAEAAFSKRN